VRTLPLWLALVYLAGCPSKSVDRRVDESVRQEVKWKESKTVDVAKAVDQQVNKGKRTVKRTPVVTPSGVIVTLPNGQPAFTEEIVDETENSSVKAKTDVNAKSDGLGASDLDASRKIRDKTTTDWHAWKLRALALLLAVGLGWFIWTAFKRWI
jgi:hypothetical protein